LEFSKCAKCWLIQLISPLTIGPVKGNSVSESIESKAFCKEVSANFLRNNLGSIPDSLAHKLAYSIAEIKKFEDATADK
jgi:hypothetical protein